MNDAKLIVLGVILGVAVIAGVCLLCMRLNRQLGGPHHRRAVISLAVIYCVAYAVAVSLGITAPLSLGAGLGMVGAMIGLSERAGPTWARLGVLALGALGAAGLLVLIWRLPHTAFGAQFVYGALAVLGPIFVIAVALQLRKILSGRSAALPVTEPSA